MPDDWQTPKGEPQNPIKGMDASFMKPPKKKPLPEEKWTGPGLDPQGLNPLPPVGPYQVGTPAPVSGTDPAYSMHPLQMVGLLQKALAMPPAPAAPPASEIQQLPFKKSKGMTKGNLTAGLGPGMDWQYERQGAAGES